MGARSIGGRWNPPQSFSTLYLALERETAIREFLRLVERTGRSPIDFLPRTFYRYEVHLQGLLDLSTDEALDVFGLNLEGLAATDLAHCQAIGEAAQYAGREGIMAPSATGAGKIIAVFWDRLQPGSYVRDADHEEWKVEAS